MHFLFGFVCNNNNIIYVLKRMPIVIYVKHFLPVQITCSRYQQATLGDSQLFFFFFCKLNMFGVQQHENVILFLIPHRADFVQCKYNDINLSIENKIENELTTNDVYVDAACTIPGIRISCTLQNRYQVFNLKLKKVL